MTAISTHRLAAMILGTSSDCSCLGTSLTADHACGFLMSWHILALSFPPSGSVGPPEPFSGALESPLLSAPAARTAGSATIKYGDPGREVRISPAFESHSLSARRIAILRSVLQILCSLSVATHTIASPRIDIVPCAPGLFETEQHLHPGAAHSHAKGHRSPG
ncbi:hypothetical protein LZ30DRAFT_284816 [Colletotrichum cereale]|nr:hypothetical protein LZ30DRAFT_284816 [Colletotrichum cereale]